MPKILSSQPILLIDDNPYDYEATKRTFQQLGLKNPLMYCADGDEALDLLQGRSPMFQAALPPRPGLILLDLNLPGTDGRDVLMHLKGDPQLKTIPIIILTTSSDPEDIESCYLQGANSYMVKPVNYDGLVEAMRRLFDFWLEVAQISAAA